MSPHTNQLLRAAGARRAAVTATATALTILAGTLTTPAAHARPGDFGLDLGAEYAWYGSDAIGIASSDARTAEGLIALSYQPVDLLTIYLGWRHLGSLGRGDSLADAQTNFAFKTEADGIVAGARICLPIVAGLSFIGELDLEALHVATRVALGNAHDDTGAWAPGAVPKVGLAYHIPVFDGLALDLRVIAGYALRLDAPLAPVTFAPSPEVRAAPTELGALNLSGPVIGATLGVTF